MKNKKNLISFFVLIIFLILGFFLINYSSKLELQDIKEIKIAGQSVKVDLALTGAEQAQGLSGKTGLQENTGMLFVFDTPGKYSFWMKDMLFPIDIIWFTPSTGGATDMKVIYIKADAKPELYPETYGPGPSDPNAKYVLEVSSGFSEKNSLKVGDGVEFTY